MRNLLVGNVQTMQYLFTKFDVHCAFAILAGMRQLQQILRFKVVPYSVLKGLNHEDSAIKC